MSAPFRARWYSTSEAYALVPVGIRGVLRGTVVVSAVLAFAACGSGSQVEEQMPGYPHRPIPTDVMSIGGETQFGFAVSREPMSDDEIAACTEVVQNRTKGVSVVVTEARDGLVFGARRVPSGPKIVELARAVRDCDLDLSFYLPGPGPPEDTPDIEPAGEWAPVHSGDTDGVHWTIYRVPATPDLDGLPTACYAVEVGPSSGPVLPTTTIIFPGEDRFSGLSGGCGVEIGPKPVRQVLRPGAVVWQPMQVLSSDLSNESYVWIAGKVAPEVDHVRIQGADLPVVEQTFFWLSREADARPSEVELPALHVRCGLQYERAPLLTVLDNC